MVAARRLSVGMCVAGRLMACTIRPGYLQPWLYAAAACPVGQGRGQREIHAGGVQVVERRLFAPVCRAGLTNAQRAALGRAGWGAFDVRKEPKHPLPVQGSTEPAPSIQRGEASVAIASLNWTIWAFSWPLVRRGKTHWSRCSMQPTGSQSPSDFQPVLCQWGVMHSHWQDKASALPRRASTSLLGETSCLPPSKSNPR